MKSLVPSTYQHAYVKKVKLYNVVRPFDRVWGKKKRKLYGFWEANCVVTNGDCAGLCNRVDKQIFNYQAQKKNQHRGICG